MATRSPRSTTTDAARIAPLPKAAKSRTTKPATSARAKKAVMGAVPDAAKTRPAPQSEIAPATVTHSEARLLEAAGSAEMRLALIAEAAYFRAAGRHFAPGYEVEDWLAAEAEVDGKLKRF